MTVSKASILAVVYGVLLLVLPATTTEALTTKQAVARRRHRKLIKQHIESESTNNHKIHHYHPDRDYRRRMPDYHGKSSKHGKSGSKDYGYGGYGGAAEEGDFYFPGDGDSDTTDESGVAYEDVDAEGGAVDSDFSVPSNSSGMVAPVETEAPDDDTDDGPVFTSSPEGPDADGSVSGGGDSDATEAPGSSPGSGTEDSNNSTVVDGRLETESPTDSPTWMPTEDDSTESPTWFPTDSPSDDVEGRDDLDLDATEAPSTAKSAGQDAVVSTSPPVAQTKAPDVTTNTTGDGSEVIGVDIGNSVTAEYCVGVSADKETDIAWTYAVDFQPNLLDSQRDQALNVLELQLVSEVMDCETASIGKRMMRQRRLQMEGVAGLDYMPRDIIREDEVCFGNSTEGDCYTVDGRMELILEQTANGQAIRNDILARIQATMAREDFPLVPEIIGVYYLGPDLNTVAEAQGGSETTSRGSQIESDMSAGMVAAFAAIGFVAFFGVMLIFRRRRRSPDTGSLTLEPGSAMTSRAETPSKSPRVSPFSAMLPQAYNLHDPETMSAILEGDSHSESSGSVIVSEGGFTTDGDGDSVYTNNLGPVLGAHKQDDDHEENDLLFENEDTSVSTIDKINSKDTM